MGQQPRGPIGFEVFPLIAFARMVITQKCFLGVQKGTRILSKLTSGSFPQSIHVREGETISWTTCQYFRIPNLPNPFFCTKTYQKISITFWHLHHDLPKNPQLPPKNHRKPTTNLHSNHTTASPKDLVAASRRSSMPTTASSSCWPRRRRHASRRRRDSGRCCWSGFWKKCLQSSGRPGGGGQFFFVFF